MCGATHSNTRACGVCVKLKNLLKVHYKRLHCNYTVCITVTGASRKRRNISPLFQPCPLETVNISPLFQPCPLETVNMSPLFQPCPLETVKLESVKREYESADVMAESLETDETIECAAVKQPTQPCNSNKPPAVKQPTQPCYSNKPPAVKQPTQPCYSNKPLASNVMTVTQQYTNAALDNNANSAEYLCVCGKQFKTKRELNFHKKVHSKVADPIGQPFKCDVCDRRFTRKDILRVHMRTHGVHPQYCGSSTTSDDALQTHRRAHSTTSDDALQTQAAQARMLDADQETSESKSTAQSVDTDSTIGSTTELTIAEGTHTPAEDERAHACDMCEKRFKQSASVRMHMRVHGLYKCFCGETFTNDNHLTKHGQTHTDAERLAARMRNILKTRSKRSEKPHKCKVCSKSFKFPCLLRRHETSHIDVVTEGPSHTGSVTERSSHMDRVTDRKSCAPGSVECSTGGAHACSMCENSYAFERQLKTHLRRQHLVVACFNCDLCTRSFADRSRLKEHMRSHSTVRPFACDVCCKTFKRKYTLHTHSLSHVGLSCTYKCSHCDKSFLNKHHASIHERSHTEGKVYHCEFCATSCSTLYSLKAHIRLHTGEKPYKCEHCDFRATRKATLDYHNSRHSDVKNVLCSVCSKMFKSTHNLRSHMRSHTGIKKHKCDVCGKMFVRKQGLNNHMTSHSDERKYPCEYCPSAFKRSEHRKTHMRSHHPDKLDQSQVKKTATSSKI